MKIKGLLLIAAVVSLSVCGCQSGGPAISFWTEQVAEVDSGNSLGIEFSYYLGNETGGLEPYIGTDWWPRWDDEGDMEPPGVFVLGTRYHFSDIIDPNSAIPLIPGLFLAVLNEEISMTPYVNARFSANFIDKDAGLMSLGAGVSIKTTPDSDSALRFELRKTDTFGDLAVVPDNRLDLYMGIYYPY